MNTPARLGAFAAGLAATFAAAFGVGAATGSQVEMSEGHSASTAGHGAESADHTSTAPPGGLQVAEQGYALSPVQAPPSPGTPGKMSFQILGRDGTPVTAFTPEHDKELHLIVVSRDTMWFRHVHPERDADGTWSVDWTWPAGGSFRVFADFVPAGHDGGITLGRDVDVAGTYDPEPVPPATTTTTVDDYEVALDGDLVAGSSSEVVLTVRRDGRTVTDLEPYLGAYGHLVAIRVGDLAYLHVHPSEPAADGEPGHELTFSVQVPSTGTYRLFLDFQHEGTVHTAEFTVEAGGGAQDGGNR